MNILQRIFTDHYEEIIYTLHPRKTEIDNIDKMINCLFHSVSSVISRMFFNLNHAKNFTPGYIMVLHTFGRDLKWNPHIHCLLSEGGYSDDGFWRHVKHFH